MTEMNFDSRRRNRRLLYWVVALALSSIAVEATPPAMTTVSDIVYRADGTAAAGTLIISWGESRLAIRAKNYFGIKGHAALPCVTMSTSECVNGKLIKVMAKFARFASMAE